MKMDLPKISIIIPLYNKATQIGRCLESILLQTYYNFEALVIDDGSTDDSYNVALQYSRDERIKVIRKENGGVSSARNFGIERAKGDYIVFVDSDDWVEENYIKDFFSLNEKPVRSLGMQSVETLKGNERELVVAYDNRVIDKENFGGELGKFKILHNGFPFAKLYDTRLLNEHKIRFIEGLPTHEDHVFVLTYIRYVDSIILSSAANYKYILDENPNSLSKKLYEPEVFLYASDCLVDAMNEINKSFNLNPTYYYRALTDYGVTQRIRAILSAYIKGRDKQSRLKLLRQEFRINKSLYRHYKSKRKLQDLVVWTMTRIPIRLLDMMLNLCVTIAGVKGKEIRLYIR